jgi:hypothetical protein
VSGASLPLPEPPATDVDHVLELLRGARGYYSDAEQQAELLLASFGEDAGEVVEPVLAMYYRVELTVSQQRLRYWEAMVELLETRAHAMGLHP